MKEPTPRHQALVDAWRDVATAGDVDDKREAYQAAMLAIFRPGGPVDEGEIDKAEATDEAVELGEAHDGLFRDREELEHLIRQASLGWRALAPCRPREPGEWAPNSLWNPANIKVAAPAIRATPYQWRELQEIRRRAWLYGRHYIRGFLSTTIGRPGLGKTDLAIVESIDMAAARKILDHQDRDPLRVWYLGEDTREELERRVATACAVHVIGGDDLGGRLSVDSVQDLPALHIAEQGSKGAIVNDAAVAQLGDEMLARKIDVLILDPLIEFHKVPEGDPPAMSVVMGALRGLARRTNAAIDLPHHTRKPPPGIASVATVDDGRGASSIVGAVRSARVLNAMSQQEAERAGIAEGDRWRYLRIDDGKANMKPPEGARWLQHVSEMLPCGESVGVIAPWKFPDAFAGFSANDLPRIRELARTGAHRSDTRSPQWFGHPVADMLGLDLDDTPTRARIKQMIKTWLKTRVLSIETRPDEQRRPRQYIVPGPFDATPEDTD